MHLQFSNGIKRKPGRPSKYGWEHMEVGDFKHFQEARIGGKEYVAAKNHARYHNKEFSFQKIEKGLIVWRER